MNMHYNYPSSQDYLTPAVRFLMISNIVIFIIYAITSKYGYGFIHRYFALTPAYLLDNLELWQLVTHSFLHDTGSLWHIFVNLLMLFFFGHIVERHYGTKNFYICYFACAIFGGLVYVIYANYVGYRLVPAVGASGALMGILMVAASLRPNATVLFMFFIPMTMRTLIFIVIGFDLYNAFMISEASAAGHLGGAAGGYLFFRYGRRALGWLNSIEQRIEKQHKKDQQAKYKNMRKKVDELLDRISKDGMNSLSDKEKDFLKQASKDYRNE